MLRLKEHESEEKELFKSRNQSTSPSVLIVGMPFRNMRGADRYNLPLWQTPEHCGSHVRLL